MKKERARISEVSSELFYRQGLEVVVDSIIAELAR